MFRHIAGLIAAVIGVFFAFLIGLWALLSLAVVAIVATIVHAFRSREAGEGRRKRHRHVIEGEFSVVDEHKPDENKPDDHDRPGPPAPRP